jgi:hypothetical protein
MSAMPVQGDTRAAGSGDACETGASHDIRSRSAIRHFSPARGVGDAIPPNTR